MTPIYVIIQPFNPATGARETIRLASALSSTAYGLDGAHWHPALVTRPTLSISTMSPTLDGRVQPGRAGFSINLAHFADKRMARWKWGGAPVEIYSAPDLKLLSTPDFAGQVTMPSLDRDNLTLSIEASVETTFLEKPALYREFDGSSGLGGDPEMRGTLMPAGFGVCENIPPVWFDKTNWIGMVDGYNNTLAITALMEGLNDFGPRVADYADYAALLAAIENDEIPPGRWASSVAEGLVGLGAPPVGEITVNATFGANRIGSISRRLLEHHAGVPLANIDTDAFDAIDDAVPHAVHVWIGEQRDVKDLIEKLAVNAVATPLVTGQRLVTITRAVETAPVATLDRSGRMPPRVRDWQTAPSLTPVWRMTARVARPASVTDLKDVNYVDDIIDRGAFNVDTVYRAGNLVWGPGKSSYLYTGDVAEAGHPLPVAPATSNDWWQQLTPPSTATDLTYADGTPIEELKPAEPGATEGAPPGTPVGDRPAEQVTDELDQHTASIAAAEQAIDTAQGDIDGLILTYGETAAAAASAAAAEAAEQLAQQHAANAAAAEANAGVSATEAEGYSATASQASGVSVDAKNDSVAAADASQGYAANAADDAAAVAADRQLVVQYRQDTLDAKNTAVSSAGIAQNEAAVATDGAATATEKAELAASLSDRMQAVSADLFPETLNAALIAAAASSGPSSDYDPVTVTNPEWVSGGGTLIEPPAGHSQLGHIGMVPLIEGVIYEVTLGVLGLNEGGGVYAANYLRVLDGSLNLVTNIWGGTASWGVAPDYGERVIRSNRFGLNIDTAANPGVTNITTPGAAFVRPIVLFNRDSVGGVVPTGRLRLTALYAKNITAIPALEANVSRQAGVLAQQGDGAIAYLEQIAAATGSNPAKFQLLAGKNGSRIGLVGDVIALGNKVDGIIADVLTIMNGNATFGSDVYVNSGKIVVDTGTHMKVIGNGFGTSNQFIEWFGPKMALSLCSEDNGITFIKTNGDAYFSGSIAAGTISNSGQTTLAGETEFTLGPFLSNGNQITVVATGLGGDHLATDTNTWRRGSDSPLPDPYTNDRVTVRVTYKVESSINGGSSWVFEGNQTSDFSSFSRVTNRGRSPPPEPAPIIGWEHVLVTDVTRTFNTTIGASSNCMVRITFVSAIDLSDGTPYPLNLGLLSLTTQED